MNYFFFPQNYKFLVFMIALADPIFFRSGDPTIVTKTPFCELSSYPYWFFFVTTSFYYIFPTLHLTFRSKSPNLTSIPCLLFCHIYPIESFIVTLSSLFGRLKKLFKVLRFRTLCKYNILCFL